MSILELGIRDRFEFVPTRWPHSWATQGVSHPTDFVQATPAERIPALVTPDFALTDSHSICDYLNGELELDAVLDPQACRDAAERERISRQLHALVGQVAGLSQVRIHHTLEASPSQPAALR